MFVTSTFLNHVSASSLKFITMEIEVFFGRTFDDDGEAASALKILLISTQRPTTSASARPSGAWRKRRLKIWTDIRLRRGIHGRGRDADPHSGD